MGLCRLSANQRLSTLTRWFEIGLYKLYIFTWSKKSQISTNKRKIEENIEDSENIDVKKSKVGTPKNKNKFLIFQNVKNIYFNQLNQSNYDRFILLTSKFPNYMKVFSTDVLNCERFVSMTTKYLRCLNECNELQKITFNKKQYTHYILLLSKHIICRISLPLKRPPWGSE